MEKVIVKDSIVKLRLNPSLKSEVSDEVFHGMRLTIDGEMSDGWLKVTTEYDYFGYLHKDSIISDTDVVSKWYEQSRKIVTKAFADVLINPKIQSQIIATLPMGAFILVKDCAVNNGFVKVELVNGDEGWIREAFLEQYKKLIVFEESNDLRNKIANVAMKFSEAQYRWGGKTQLGIDCSGLCFMAYFVNGVNIYRDAKIVENFPIKRIEYKNAKKADLLFFSGHVGMYLGNGTFIHSSFLGNGVGINSVDPDDFRYRKDLADEFLGAGSIFNALI